MTELALRRVAPFGHLGISACVPLPRAYRSLPRPSSPPCAQAFPTCLHSLDSNSFSYQIRAIYTSETIQKRIASLRCLDSFRMRVVRRPCWISTIMLSFGCQTAVPGYPYGAPGQKKKTGLSVVVVRAGDTRALSVQRADLLACSVKEVIQPQVPLRLPCYDFAPVTRLAFGGLLPCGLRHRLRALRASMA